jgi:hypothetical protein
MELIQVHEYDELTRDSWHSQFETGKKKEFDLASDFYIENIVSRPIFPRSPTFPVKQINLTNYRHFQSFEMHSF